MGHHRDWNLSMIVAKYSKLHPALASIAGELFDTGGVMEPETALGHRIVCRRVGKSGRCGAIVNNLQ